MSEWIAISDKLPEPDEGVLVTDGRVITAARLEYLGSKPYWWGGHGFDGYEWTFDFPERFDAHAVTHWMCLPSFPNVSDSPQTYQQEK